MENRYLNKKLRRAIDERYPMFWEFGEFRKWYTGLILRAYTGFAETGRQYTHMVFATTSIDGAREIREILAEKGIETTGWENALQNYEDYINRWPGQRVFDRLTPPGCRTLGVLDDD